MPAWSGVRRRWVSRSNLARPTTEGTIVDWIGESRSASGVHGIIINPGAYTHTSIAILDAISCRRPSLHRGAPLEDPDAQGAVFAAPLVPGKGLRRARRGFRCRQLQARLLRRPRATSRAAPFAFVSVFPARVTPSIASSIPFLDDPIAFVPYFTCRALRLNVCSPSHEPRSRPTECALRSPRCQGDRRVRARGRRGPLPCRPRGRRLTSRSGARRAGRRSDRRRQGPGPQTLLRQATIST